ncbi:LysR family transcriptional regulator [Aeromonas allosaccharophila]|uniref:LysR family transcriptional regulator n=1 Tax=Aeromonas allosaccharophila TaxID=656 RepID=UPI001BCD6223|nr:LysR family transcriptional regulator [Aeromonas allosaccharophila]MBS4694270.1 LysR family transcriptional regulator [Aeromonas allosaccharophila]
MDQIAAMRTFIKVVECQSFTKAANQLGISVAMASKLMQQLEESLATRLLSRTTRQVNPTEAGQFYYQRSLALLAELEETHSQLTHHNQQPNGTLKLSVPMDFGYLHLSPALPLFRQRFPDLKLDIEYSDRRVALVEEGFDLALRIGHLSDSSLVARQLATIKLELCASPAYLARKGAPQSPEDLKQHDCLIYTLTQPEWHFKRGGEAQSIRPQGPLRANNGVALTRAACDDQGIILQPTFIVGEALRAGQLVSLLPEWDKGEVGLYAVYPHRRFVSAKVRCFIEFVQERYLAPQQWDTPT